MVTIESLFTNGVFTQSTIGVDLGKKLLQILQLQDVARENGWPQENSKEIDAEWHQFFIRFDEFCHIHKSTGLLYEAEKDILKKNWGSMQPPERLRMVITVPQAATWGELVFRLRESGFMVDHFHVVEEMDGREYVSHLNIFFDRDGRAKEARWGADETENQLEESCHGYTRISADVWHDH